jgi:phospholipid/cholesterol/gamma-HCH transport system permease protein
VSVSSTVGAAGEGAAGREAATLSTALASDGAVLRLRLGGAWRLGARPPVLAPASPASPVPPVPRAHAFHGHKAAAAGFAAAVAAVAAEVEGHGVRRVDFDCSELAGWDSALVLFVVEVTAACARLGAAVERAGLPAGVRRLVELSEATPDQQEERGAAARQSAVERVGVTALAIARHGGELLEFLGETSLAFERMLRGRARYRRGDLLLFIQQTGIEALGIVTLISFLVGLILAFVGAVQLQRFGASIYVADLVGIAMVREMGAMMTAVVMAGRSGAAFAAQIGTMRVTQEIDALDTLGISPIEFLVLPRVVALTLMMPLLCLYADVLGIAGGAVVGTTLLHLSPQTYWQETFGAVSLTNLGIGLLKALVYGVLVSVAGCLRGLKAGSSSAAVGQAVTSAVVTGIVYIISSCGVFAVLFYMLGI